MFKALMISATGMSAQQIAMDNISNNLANVNTTAFKTSQAKFSDLYSQQLQEPGDVPSGAPVTSAPGAGVKNSAILHQFTQGTLDTTGNPLDLAIQGSGFFQVVRPDGTLGYTRDGSFKVSPEGVLCTAQGYPLSTPVEIPQDAAEVSIGANGIVSIRRASDTAPRAVAQLELANFVNPNGLENLGNNLYAATPASGEPTVNTPGQEGLGTITAGSLERSNVNLVQEMVNMIMTQRAYEINSKSIQASDEMIKLANNLQRA